MAAKGDVELIIRAKNEATKNLDQINSAMEKLAEQQTTLSQTGEKADDTLGRLGAEFSKLQANLQNLTALKGIQAALDTATEAMVRQRAKVDESANSYQQLQQRQAEAKQQVDQLAQAVNEATQNFDRENNALRASRGELTQYSRDARGLVTEQGRIERSMATTAAAIEKQSASVQEAKDRQAQLAAEMASTDAPTKRLQSAFEAANRTLERRTAKLDELRNREGELRSQLETNAQAQTRAAQTVQQATSAYEQQQQTTRRAKENLADLNVSLRDAGRYESQLGQDVDKASQAFQRQQAALDQAQNEYRQVEDAADKARTTIGQTSASTEQQSTSARRAAAELATLAARMRTIQSAPQSRDTGFGFDANAIRESEAVMRQAAVTIRAAGNEAAQGSVSARELNAALKAVGGNQRQLQQVGDVISRQRQAVDGAQQSWKTAEAEVRRLAMAMRDTEQPTEQMGAALGRAQGQARLAKTEFQQQSQRAEQLASTLRSAGIGSGDLTTAQAALQTRLANANSTLDRGTRSARELGREARTSAADTRNLGNAAQQAGAGAESGSRGILGMVHQIRSLGRESRSSMSVVQRLRGQLLAMASGAIGLYQVQAQVRSIVELGNELEANRMRLGVAFNDAARGVEELEYSRSVAENLRLPLNELTTAYANLTSAARGTSLEGEGARQIFEAFSQVARVNRMSVSELDGTFRALTQVISKGKVQAEELRNQLGDRFPGAIQIMADGLGIGVGELEKLMETGGLTSEALLYMASEASNRVGPMLAAALDSPQAKMQALANTWQRAKETMAESGFLDALGEAAERLMELLASERGVEAMQQLADLLVTIANLMIDLIPHLNTILTSMAAIGGVWFTGVMISAITSIVTAARALAPLLYTAAGGATALSLALGWVVALVAAFSLAKWAYDNVPAFGAAMIRVGEMAQNAWATIAQSWEMTGEWLKNSFGRLMNFLALEWAGLINSIVQGTAGLLSFIGMGDLVTEAMANYEAANARQEQSEEQHQAAMQRIRDRYADQRLIRERENAARLEEHMHRFREQAGETEPSTEPPEVTPPSGPGTSIIGRPNSPYAAPGDGDNAAARRREQLEQQLANRLYTIRSQLAQRSAQTEMEQMEAVRVKYEKDFELMRQLGLDRNSEEWKTVEALIAQEQEQIKINNAKEVTREAARATREQEEAVRAAMQRVNRLLALRKELQEQILYLQKQNDPSQQGKIEEYRDALNRLAPEIQDAVADAERLIDLLEEGPGKDNFKLALDKLRISAENLKDEMSEVGKELTNTFASGATSGILSATEAVWGMIDGTLSLKDGINAVFDAFRKFAADFLLKIAEMIIQQQILNALQKSAGGGGIFGALIGGVTAAMNHEGGLIGTHASGFKTVSPSVFTNAQRFHKGGITGLKPNEVPIIAEKDEEMLTRDDPRHRFNLGGNSTNGGNGNQGSIKIVNAIDSASVVEEGLKSSVGERSILNFVRANKSKINSLLR